MPLLEICIESNDLLRLAENISALNQTDIARIELCQDMHLDGLTPNLDAVSLARESFQRAGLMVMIRPRAGDFCYDEQEIDLMHSQITQVAELGVNGVVFGVLSQQGKVLNLNALSHLSKHSKSLGLEVGIHRAIDVVENRKLAFEQLLSLKVNRVLTSGGRWGDKRLAVDNIAALKQLLSWTHEQIEIVIAGGVSAENAIKIVDEMTQISDHFSLHAYSGVLTNKIVNIARVKSLQECGIRY